MSVNEVCLESAEVQVHPSPILSGKLIDKSIHTGNSWRQFIPIPWSIHVNSIWGNQFNFSERAAQSKNAILRERSWTTEPPPTTRTARDHWKNGAGNYRPKIATPHLKNAGMGNLQDETCPYMSKTSLGQDIFGVNLKLRRNNGQANRSGTLGRWLSGKSSISTWQTLKQLRFDSLGVLHVSSKRSPTWQINSVDDECDVGHTCCHIEWVAS